MMTVQTYDDLQKYTTDGLPTYKTHLGAGGKTWWFTCAVCGKRHSHGAGIPGHRVSHCVDRGAFPAGYWLEPPVDDDEEDEALP